MTRLVAQVIRFSIVIFGLGGFVSLLIASHFAPAIGAPLRYLSFVWFLGFGIARVAFEPIHRAAAAREINGDTQVRRGARAP
ncbi:MAG: hypothetical protein ACHP84_13305 [Caulobacterales bacterium]|jgi:hypothetical protein